MEPFDAQKEKYLQELSSSQKDRSKKGDVDTEILPLLDAINAHPDLYSTSSCAGRIDLFVEPGSGKKHEGEWLFVSHEEADPKGVVAALKTPAETVWFRMEGAILHVCCRDMDAADSFLKACKTSGWKHSGVTGTSPRIMVEATTSERMDVPIAKEGSLFVPERFLTFLTKEANAKLGKTREKMARLERALRA